MPTPECATSASITSTEGPRRVMPVAARHSIVYSTLSASAAAFVLPSNFSFT
jgi:hypothetical protein